jgi:16S rRNA (uracil1498-N3)-methyltransferase
MYNFKKHRFFFKNLELTKNLIIKDKDFIHQISKVLRKKNKDQIILLNNSGRDYLYEIIEINKKYIILNLLNLKNNKNFFPFNLKLYLVPPHNKDILNQIIKSSVELGINEISFIKTSRMQAKYNLNYERLEKINKEAYEQSERAFKAKINPLIDYQKIQFRKKETIFFCDSFNQTNNKILNNKNLFKKDISFIIGPEGGFSQEESFFLKEKSDYSINLSQNILRMETACVSFLSLINALFLQQQ